MSSCDNSLVIEDLNSDVCEIAISEFCETYDLQNLVKDTHVIKILPNPPLLI